MGWFLSSKPNTDKAVSSKASRSKSARDEWDPDRTFRRLQAIAWIVGVLIVVTGWPIIQRHLVAYVGDHRTPERFEIVLTDLPQWVSKFQQEKIKSLIMVTLHRNPMLVDRLNDTVDVLASDPWISKVNRVERGQDGKIHVHGEYRQPVALVKQEEGYYLVDREARWLPVFSEGGAEQAYAKFTHLPVIVGVGGVAPSAGESWGGDDISAGLRMAALISDKPFTSQVRAIDVSNFDGRMNAAMPQLSLLTREDGQTMVRWGRPPGEESIYEPDVETKMRRLQSIYRRYGTIDAGGRIVDIFLDKVFTYTPNSS